MENPDTTDTDVETADSKYQSFDTRSFGSAALDALPTQIAVLDTDGTIVYTNETWRRFAQDNGFDDDPGMLGENYVEVCEQSSSRDAEQIANGLHDVYDGDRDTFAYEYPCHSETERRWFTMRAIRFEQGGETLLLVAHHDITERKLSEQEVERRNRQLEQLNSIGRLIREIVRSLLDVSRREDVEDIVCRELADARFYDLAWVVDRGVDGRIQPRAGAGADEFLDDVAELDRTALQRSTVGDALDGNGPVVQRDESDPLQEVGAAQGLDSYLALPLTYRDARYGALVVHASRPNAFTELERDAFSLLGETLGYALNAVESRELLHGEYATELRLQVTDSRAPLAALSRETDGTLEVTGSTTAGDGLKLFVEGQSVSAETVTTVLEDHEQVENVNVLGSTEDRCRFEAAIDRGSPMLSIAERGATVNSGTIENGIYTLIVETSSTADIADLVGHLQGDFDDASLRAKQRVERHSATLGEYWDSLEERLTDRQLAILEASFHAGYFEWPREADGGDVAESFDISPPTFHEHMRAGLSKVMEELFERR
ncbi:bacterio-opsin activator domain-containing protein [Haloarchaeobius sp. TZWWS8]|uniref:bacterio-opsin activator domain-containing protein n=1 Tax=Haloarchaeobius sp. TZWWS8 TaxID=3446121 RepID=UPI003EB8E1EC